jgi:putative ABC transport system permease protein
VFRIAWRNLVEDRPRLGISVGGVALAVVLVLLLQGLLGGMFRQITAYLDGVPAQYLVGQSGISNFQGAASRIPISTAEEVRALPGVGRAIPVLAQYSVLEFHESKVTVFLIGYQPDRGGGPWRLAAGREVQAADEIVLDKVLADRHGLALGGLLQLMGEPFRVVGLSSETSSWMMSLAFLRHDAAARLLGAPDSTSFVFVDGQAGESSLGDRLKASFPALAVERRLDVAENDRAYIGGIFAAPLRLMVLIAIAIGALLVGLTIYSATVERVREYGVLKAVGMRNRRLYGIVVAQAALATLAGLVLALGLFLLLSSLVQAVWPQFLITVTVRSLAFAALGSLTMALLAALAPALHVASLDPARAFRR